MNPRLAARTALFVLSLACSIGLAPTAFAQGAEQPATRDSFITTPDGIKIHYLEAGKRPAILFVPGWTMPAWIWERQIAHFSKSFHVSAIDPRAQGESTQASEGLYPAARALDIKAVVDQLKLAPVVLVGWSMGVTEICAYVDQFGTDGIADLVLVDGVPGFDLPPERLKGVISFFGGFQKDRRKATEDFVRGMYKKPQTEDYLQRVIKASLLTPTNSAAALTLGAIGSDYWGVLPKINRPALVVAAQSPFVSGYQRMQREIPGARIEIFEGAGHALFVDDPERFNSLLDAFLTTMHRPMMPSSR